MIVKSWTFERMNRKERALILEILSQTPLPVSTRAHASAILNAIYSAFLHGLGYTPFHWREPDDSPNF